MRIRQGDERTGRLVTGDQLDVVFSFDHRGLNDTVAFGPSGAAGPVLASSARPLPWLLADLAMATTPPGGVPSIAPPVTASDTYVTCTGTLTLVPLEAAEARPDSTEEALATLVGAPVHLHDFAQGLEGRGDTIHYRSSDDRVDLVAGPQQPVLVVAPDFRATAPTFWSSRARGIGGMGGPGIIVGVAPAPDLPAGRAGTDAMMRAWARTVTAGQAAPDAGTPIDPTIDETLRITWTQGVDLTFGPKSDPKGSDRLREAVFRGDVDVSSPDFHLDAATMTVGFAPSATDDNAIDRILAEGDVVATNLGDAGRIDCRTLELRLVDIDGTQAPDTMIAIGGVVATDATQTMWTEHLTVTFDPAPADEDATPAPDAPGTPGLRRVNARTVLAEGDVQVLLPKGERVFADRLDGDVAGGRAELTGGEVIIVRDNVLFDKGTKVILVDKAIDEVRTQTAHWDGPGQFRVFTKSIQAPTRDRIERPAVEDALRDLEPEARIRWDESMFFDGAYNGGNGYVDFRGNVDGRSDPSPLEHRTLKAKTLTLELERVAE
ncbi:MAG: hypothetical protein KDA25_08195, partial [Phycisphaerales bacterium]|nr:hypothetical protein [Phycisphaerales bacterium]